MTQSVFAGSSGTIPNLNANFSELYNSTNGTGQLATKVTGAGNSAGSVSTTYTLCGNANFEFVDSTRAANNKVIEWLWSGGSFQGRFLNDAYGSASPWLIVTGGQAAGISAITHYGDVQIFNNSAGAERARIDITGNLLVGTTSLSTPNPGAVLNAQGQLALGNAAGASGFVFHNLFRSGVAIGSITQSGTTAVLFNTTSDARLKTNVVDAADAGAIIDSIKVRAFGWASAPDEHVTHGFIAQELVTVAPQAVKVGDSDAAVSDPWAVDASKLMPLVIKELQILRARLTALEAA